MATLLEKLVSRVPSAQRRFFRKQGDLAVQILDTLERLGWTQRELAAKAGMKESYISRLLAGGGNPTLKTICAIEDALGEEVLVAPGLAEYVQPATAIAVTKVAPISGSVAPEYVMMEFSPSLRITGGQHQPDSTYWLAKAAA